jgi:hypothetical protein
MCPICGRIVDHQEPDSPPTAATANTASGFFPRRLPTSAPRAAIAAMRLACVTVENVVAIGLDREGWISQQIERLNLFEIEEGEPEPTARPPSCA